MWEARFDFLQKTGLGSKFVSFILRPSIRASDFNVNLGNGALSLGVATLGMQGTDTLVIHQKAAHGAVAFSGGEKDVCIEKNSHPPLSIFALGQLQSLCQFRFRGVKFSDPLTRVDFHWERNGGPQKDAF